MTYDKTHKIYPLITVDLSILRIVNHSGLLLAKETLANTLKKIPIEQEALYRNKVYMQYAHVKGDTAYLEQLKEYQKYGENNITALQKSVEQLEKIIKIFENSI